MNSTQFSRRAQHGFSLVELMIVVAIIGIIAAIALPALNRNIMAGRETAAAGSLRNFHGAQASFNARKGRYGTLRELADDTLIDKTFANGRAVKEYVYTDGIPEPGNTYCIQATRKTDGSAEKDFNITESGSVSFVKSTTKTPVPYGEGSPLSQGEDEKPADKADPNKK